ncbi:MAG: hypothetical protein IAE91_10285 [Ignavibacteriaceae bacterium]|nr:hypothetical protein [Ignavibacteriaceae bacterium]
MSPKKTIKYSQSTLAIAIMLVVILISSASITMLNPIVEQSSSNLTSGNVAGISTDTGELVPLQLNVSEFRTPTLNVSKQVGEQNELGNIIVRGASLSQGIFEQHLFTIYNPNNFEAKSKVQFFMPQNLKGKMKIYLQDSKDSLIMYTQEESYGAKTITLPSLSERSFKVHIETIENIDSPFELVFVLTANP